MRAGLGLQFGAWWQLGLGAPLPAPATITAPSGTPTWYQGDPALSLTATMPSDGQTTTSVEWQLLAPVSPAGTAQWNSLGMVGSAPWSLTWNSRTTLHNPFIAGSRVVRALRTTAYGTTASAPAALTFWNPRLIEVVLGWWDIRFTTAGGGYQSWVSPGGMSASELKQLIGSDDTANRIVQASAGAQPQIATGINGWNKLTFNGSSHFMENLSLSWGTVDSFSMTAVMKQDATGGAQAWFVGVDPTSTVGQITNGAANHAIASGTTITGGTPNTQVKMVTGIFNKAGNDILRINGSAVTTADAGSNSHPGSLRIAADRLGGAFFDGDGYSWVFCGQPYTAGDLTHLAAWQTANGLSG